MTKYCKLCERKVDPAKKAWSWGWFFVWCLAFGVGGIVYALYHLLLKAKIYCPICWTTKLKKHSPEEEAEQEEQKRQKREARAEKSEIRKEKMESAVVNIKDRVKGE